MGKKQISQMTFFDYVVGITIGSIASSVSVELEETLVGIASLATWSFLAVFVGWFALKSPRWEKLVQGVPSPVISNGKIREKSLANELITTEDLLMMLREKGVFSVSDVETALLEPNGRLSVLLKSDRQPLTGKSTGIKVPPQGMIDTVILDGRVQREALLQRGYTLAWLDAELEKHGVSDRDQVTLAQLDASGNLWLDLKDDQNNMPKPQSKKLLLADLIKVQAELELLALDADDPEARQLYSRLAADAGNVLRDLEPFLR